MSSHLKKIFQFFLFLGIGGILMYWLYIKQVRTYQIYCDEHQIPSSQCNLFDKLWNDLISIHPIYIFSIFIAFFMSNYFRSLRWRMMLSSIGYEVHPVNSIGSILVGYLANLGLPRSGEFIRAALLSKYEKVPLTISVGTVVLDRIIDVLSMGLIVLITVFIQYQTFLKLYQEHLANVPLLQQLIIPILLILFLLLAFFTRNTWRDWNFITQFKNKIRGFLDGLLSIRNIQNKTKFVFYTSMIWFWFFVMMFLALKSFQPTNSLPISTALVIYVFGSMGMLVPTPGGMGSYHFLVILALAYYNINEVDAFSFANISFFSANFANNITLGLIGMITMWYRQQKWKSNLTGNSNLS